MDHILDLELRRVTHPTEKG